MMTQWPGNYWPNRNQKGSQRMTNDVLKWPNDDSIDSGIIIIEWRNDISNDSDQWANSEEMTMTIVCETQWWPWQLTVMMTMTVMIISSDNDDNWQWQWRNGVMTNDNGVWWQTILKVTIMTINDQAMTNEEE